jgi:hypothetical protein
MVRAYAKTGLAGILVFVLLWVIACASNEPSASPRPEFTPIASPEPSVEKMPLPSPVVVLPSPVPSPIPRPTDTVKQDYIVSEEVFNQTFAELQELIDRLNDIIAKGDMATWQSYLSQAYKDYYSDRAVLTAQSESPILKARDIRLASLADFFRYVVVPSRANVRLDDLRFLNENEVEAIMLFGGNRRITVYRLIKIDNTWRIGLASER